MMSRNRRLVALCVLSLAAWPATHVLAQRGALPAAGAAQPSVTVNKPSSRTVTGGECRVLSDGTLSAHWGPEALPTLGFTIGPGAAMADQMHANKAKFTGPGKYPNEILALYLGKTALDDSFGGLGTIVLNADGHSGTFATNDSKASGTFDCGAIQK
jgi:hypothetical protein